MNTDTKQKTNLMDDKVQQELNTPLVDPSGFDAEDKALLSLILELLKSGKIDFYKPDSLINFNVYDKLDEEMKGKIDFEAVNLTTAIREISDLHEGGFDESYQMQNLVHRVRLTKERIEDASGDLFLI
ncbi:hypothetical protein COU74_02270 [Candidatus Peregrinibacteria bacterium CG10_big_fil_rev_8_21_14_0_10_36_19]|nr:MAG: hypothetical protein COU74_02270 [Candidatus Peregrinibacteria bacterium CG10_big_fil_rev_8_21_14_0_10_36_19]